MALNENRHNFTSKILEQQTEGCHTYFACNKMESI